MQTTLILWAVRFLVRAFAGIDRDDFEAIRAEIIRLEGVALNKLIKHDIVAEAVKEIAGNITSTAVDFVIKAVLLLVRRPA